MHTSGFRTFLPSITLGFGAHFFSCVPHVTLAAPGVRESTAGFSVQRNDCRRTNFVLETGLQQQLGGGTAQLSRRDKW